jgi:hypothetical protein
MIPTAQIMRLGSNIKLHAVPNPDPGQATMSPTPINVSSCLLLLRCICSIGPFVPVTMHVMLFYKLVLALDGAF